MILYYVKWELSYSIRTDRWRQTCNNYNTILAVYV